MLSLSLGIGRGSSDIGVLGGVNAVDGYADTGIEEYIPATASKLIGYSCK